MPTLLLAKSPIPGQPPKTLLAHTQEVMAAVEYLYGTENRPSRLAREWLRFFRLEATDYNRFRINTLAAAGFHDPGKANDGFQKVVTHAGDQIIRHEHLSGLLLSLPEIKGWLRHNPLLDFDIILAAVISHHLKVEPTHWGAATWYCRHVPCFCRPSGFPCSIRCYWCCRWPPNAVSTGHSSHLEFSTTALCF
jgi:CRISPR-associated endonuclease/helicase Cas3